MTVLRMMMVRRMARTRMRARAWVHTESIQWAGRSQYSHAPAQPSPQSRPAAPGAWPEGVAARRPGARKVLRSRCRHGSRLVTVLPLPSETLLPRPGTHKNVGPCQEARTSELWLLIERQRRTCSRKPGTCEGAKFFCDFKVIHFSESHC